MYFISSKRENESNISFCDVIIEDPEYEFLEQMEQPESCAICCIKLSKKYKTLSYKSWYYKYYMIGKK